MWQGDAQAQARAEYATWLADSPYLDLMAEYGGGRGTAHGPYFITTPAPATLDDADVGALLRGRIAAGELPPPHEDIWYLLYLPSDTTSTMNGERGCLSYGGYHSSTGTGTSASSWMAYAIIPSCRGSFDDETEVVSHEIVETMSDPRGGRGYRDVDLPYGEIADLCTSLRTSYDDGASTFAVARFFSAENAAAGDLDPCVPVPEPPYVYFNAGLDPLIVDLYLDDQNRGAAVVRVEPFALGAAVTKVSWRIGLNAAPGVSMLPYQGGGVPGSTEEVTLKANASAIPGSYPLWVTASFKGYQNVTYGALVVH